MTEKKFENIYKKYAPMMHEASKSILKNEDDAYDVVQDVLFKLFHNINIKKIRNLPAYLYRMAIYKSIDGYKQNKKNINISYDDYEHVVNESKKRNSNSVEKEFIKNIDRQEKKIIINKAYNELSSIEKSVFTLRFMQGLKIKDIAEILGYHENGIKKIIRRIRTIFLKYRKVLEHD